MATQLFSRINHVIKSIGDLLVMTRIIKNMVNTDLGSENHKGCDSMIITEIKIKQVLNNLQLFKHDKISLAEAATIMTCYLETVRRHVSKG